VERVRKLREIPPFWRRRSSSSSSKRGFWDLLPHRGENPKALKKRKALREWGASAASRPPKGEAKEGSMLSRNPLGVGFLVFPSSLCHSRCREYGLRLFVLPGRVVERLNRTFREGSPPTMTMGLTVRP